MPLWIGSKVSSPSLTVTRGNQSVSICPDVTSSLYIPSCPSKSADLSVKRHFPLFYTVAHQDDHKLVLPLSKQGVIQAAEGKAMLALN